MFTRALFIRCMDWNHVQSNIIRKVTSSVNDERGRYEILSEEWDGNTFTFVYRVPDGADVTIECVSVRGDELDINWWSTNGNSGEDVFYREP